MPESNIKYKITTRKALKPETFSKFIRYIFDTFPENEPKKMANGWRPWLREKKLQLTSTMAYF